MSVSTLTYPQAPRDHLRGEPVTSGVVYTALAELPMTDYLDGCFFVLLSFSYFELLCQDDLTRPDLNTRVEKHRLRLWV